MHRACSLQGSQATSAKLTMLNQDVLDHIFECEVLAGTLPAAALVCQAWTQPVQRVLYRDILFSVSNYRQRDNLFARTMRTSPHLRGYVRTLRLITLWNHSPNPNDIDWIRLLPAHGLREFHWFWVRGNMVPAVVWYPAVRTAPRARFRGRLHDSERLQSIIDMPHLQYLTLELSGRETGNLVAPLTSQLRHLNLYLSIGHGSIIDAFLAAVGPHLESLQLTCNMGYDSLEDRQLISAIEIHCLGLRKLYISTIHMRDGAPPFLDVLVRQYPALDYLRCAEETYSARMFERLPPTLITLAFSCDSVLFKQEEALLTYLSRARRNGGRLTSLVFYSKGYPECLSRVAEACHSNGIKFSHRSEDSGGFSWN
ncbi:hypothetical protein DICSQDRAFT_151271 [Dichomitus squalens LYAD-421 SS1]|uniref:uncharacterized protein n=1 Tax=Dichomitus squalens (strain LYAD-421) TaxID=732165 RepID=UPI000441280B|nr:uncharacterized protein DICSQDRAFT_151271 [Dichomitus squalens LYAD-421 SS1]EJF66867.1 hypothetical protein DICSQDRAFT_151271 [Dichomitus squalens LYAD-421 SS1]